MATNRSLIAIGGGFDEGEGWEDDGYIGVVDVDDDTACHLA